VEDFYQDTSILITSKPVLKDSPVPFAHQQPMKHKGSFFALADYLQHFFQVGNIRDLNFCQLFHKGEELDVQAGISPLSTKVTETFSLR
jgi:hypothetical protein